jgi:hypothetical protein
MHWEYKRDETRGTGQWREKQRKKNNILTTTSPDPESNGTSCLAAEWISKVLLSAGAHHMLSGGWIYRSGIEAMVEPEKGPNYLLIVGCWMAQYSCAVIKIGNRAPKRLAKEKGMLRSSIITRLRIERRSCIILLCNKVPRYTPSAIRWLAALLVVDLYVRKPTELNTGWTVIISIERLFAM